MLNAPRHPRLLIILANRIQGCVLYFICPFILKLRRIIYFFSWRIRQVFIILQGCKTCREGRPRMCFALQDAFPTTPLSVASGGLPVGVFSNLTASDAATFNHNNLPQDRPLVHRAEEYMHETAGRYYTRWSHNHTPHVNSRPHHTQ